MIQAHHRGFNDSLPFRDTFRDKCTNETGSLPGELKTLLTPLVVWDSLAPLCHYDDCPTEIMLHNENGRRQIRYQAVSELFLPDMSNCFMNFLNPYRIVNL